MVQLRWWKSDLGGRDRYGRVGLSAASDYSKSLFHQFSLPLPWWRERRIKHPTLEAYLEY